MAGPLHGHEPPAAALAILRYLDFTAERPSLLAEVEEEQAEDDAEDDDDDDEKVGPYHRLVIKP